MARRGGSAGDSRRLWAPWREKVIAAKPKGCIFCEKPRSSRDRQNYVLRRAPRTFTMLNLYPYNNGHLLIAPYRHAGDLSRLEDGELHELFEETRRAAALLKRRLRPEGLNIGMNLGRAGGASFPGHLHVHLVPRWSGDTNFMPVHAGVKVISQSLDSVYRRLKD